LPRPSHSRVVSLSPEDTSSHRRRTTMELLIVLAFAIALIALAVGAGADSREGYLDDWGPRGLF